eukprot:gene20418-22431_t
MAEAVRPTRHKKAKKKRELLYDSGTKHDKTKNEPIKAPTTKDDGVDVKIVDSCTATKVDDVNNVDAKEQDNQGGAEGESILVAEATTETIQIERNKESSNIVEKKEGNVSSTVEVGVENDKDSKSLFAEHLAGQEGQETNKTVNETNEETKEKINETNEETNVETNETNETSESHEETNKISERILGDASNTNQIKPEDFKPNTTLDAEQIMLEDENAFIDENLNEDIEITSILTDELAQNDPMEQEQNHGDLLSQPADLLGEETSSSSTMTLVVSPTVREDRHQPVISQQFMPLSTSTMESSSVPFVQLRSETLSPFTEEQLKLFYFNPELEQVNVFIDQFLQNTLKVTHEFFELVNTYQKCRSGLVQVSHDIKTRKENVKENSKKIWTPKQCQFKAESYCQDKVKVQKVVDYEQMKFNEYEATAVNKELKEIRSMLHEDYQLKCYNSQLARVRIENYIYEMLQSSNLMRNITSEHPVTAALPRDISSVDVESLCLLQDCISVSTLQRAGALPDHFFLLNHVIRCPPCSIAPMAHFLQFPDFSRASSSAENWNCPLVHHFVVMLATLALPVRERIKFLSNYKQTMKPDMNRAISWTLVDESREEDENPEDSWSLLLETDLVALFEQFPFENLLKFLLRIKRDEEDEVYSPLKSTSNDVMKLFAFSSCAVRLLGQMFETYNLLRYRQFVKRISRTIRLIVQVLADHWCAYRSWRVELCGDSDKDIPKFMTVSNQYSLERLQLEFDQFFSKASEQILQSHSVGALQFLASMPYEAVSTNAAWSLLNRLSQSKDTEQQSYVQSQHPMNTVSLLSSIKAPGEAVFLLTSLANMALSRMKDDKDFIQVATKNILEVAYVHKSIHDTCTRNARDLLVTISSKHTFLMSFLLMNIAELIDTIAEDGVYILKALPFHLWLPETRDLEKLRLWLLENPLTSLEHKLAKAVISQMNFDLDQETGQLFLPRHMHRSMAIMLVEVYGSCVPDGPGGLKNLEYNDTGLISQVGKFAVQSIKQILNSQVQDEFVRWCWDIMLSLKLHACAVASSHETEEHQATLLAIEESEQADDSCWFSKTMSVLRNLDVRNVDMELCPEMLNVQRAVESHGHLACYVALSMTKLGHRPDDFRSHGEKLLSVLLDAGWIDCVLRIVSNILPLFVKCKHLLGNQKSEFMRIIDALVHMDANKAGYTEKIWQYPEPGLYSQKLASAITHHILSMSKESEESGNEIITLWMVILSNLTNWYRDLSVQYLLDHICKVTYFAQGKMDVVASILSEHFQNLVSLKTPRGIISSVMSWMSSSEPISLLEIKKSPDYSYYAVAVLQSEMWLEDKSGLWNEISTELTTKSDVTAEAAYKKACSKIKANYLPPFQSLSIFRWVDQGLSTNSDHPLLPLIWQQFFDLYLQKRKPEGGVPHRVGVGYRFFDTAARISLGKRIRSHLNSTASHHQMKSVPKEGAEPSAPDLKSQIHDQTMHATLASLYQAMALWMEEPRLHDSSLFLDALPDVYKPGLLVKIFAGDKSPWLQFIDMACIANEVESLESLWTMSLNKSMASKSRRIDNSNIKPTGAQQIVKRLNRETKPQCPPPIIETNNPIPVFSIQLLLTRPKLIQDLNHDLQRFVLFAKKSCLHWDENVALDEEYNELIGDLYEHILRHFIMPTPCDGRRGRKGICTGSARLVIRYEERCLRERNDRCLRDNRTAWEANVSEGLLQLPEELCCGAVYVEKVINTLMKSLQYVNEEQRMGLQSAGVELFYLLAELINMDVKRCHPAIQFFSSCTEVLGKEFIANNDSEQQRLLKTILSQDASVSFLAPHFNPSVNSRNFLQLYAFISNSDSLTTETLTTTFVLLTKFDIRAWLGTQPAISERIFAVRALMTSLKKFGVEPRPDAEMVIGLYRSHMVYLLSHRFPEQYNEVLGLMAEASRDNSIIPVCWCDFLTCIGCNIEGHCMPVYMEYNQLHVSTVADTINWLSNFFAEVSRGVSYSTSKLYVKFRPYTKHLIQLFTFLFLKLSEPYLSQDEFTLEQNKESCYAVDSTHDLTSNDFITFRFMTNTWNMIFAVYRPWIVPRKADHSWPSQHIEEATGFIQSFTESARIMSQCAMHENAFSFGLNMVWTFYCAEVAVGIKEENSLEVYHSLLATLPWKLFFPSVQDLERMLELHIANPHAFYFLGTIFCTLDWSMIFNQYYLRGDANLTKCIHLCVLRIFAMLCINKPFVCKTGSRLELFTNTVINCDWDGQNPEDIAMVCRWFGENCDPAETLEEEIYDRTIIRLLKCVCRLLPMQDSSVNHSQRRYVYVEVIVKIITRAATMKFAHKRVKSTVTTLLRDVETVFESRNISRIELTSLLNIIWTLLNSIPEGPFFNIVEHQLYGYLAETNCETLLLCSLSSGCRALASLDQVVQLCEKVIDNFLSKQSDIEFKEAWPKILDSFTVPELNQEEFVRKALSKQCLATLYGFNLHRFALCTRPTDTLNIVIETFRWCIETPPSPLVSEKSLLIWWQLLNGVKTIIETGEQQVYVHQLAKYLYLFSHYCQQISEDKSYSGILGAIGFGKKSMLPVEFRFTARCLHAFLSAQMPGNGYASIRCVPDAAGDISNSFVKDSTAPTNEAKTALQNLSNLLKNKSYALMKDEIRWVTQLISNPKTCLADGPQLLSFICKQLYYKTNFLVATLNVDDATQR